MMSSSLLPIVCSQPQDVISSFLTAQLDPNDVTSSVLTIEQVAQIKKLTYKNKRPILTADDPPFLNDILGIVVALGFDEAYSFLSHSDGFTDKNNLLKLSPMSVLPRQREQMELTTYRPIPKKGFYTCDCGSDNTITIERQSRSGDEAMKQEVKCIHCGRKWNVQ